MIMVLGTHFTAPQMSLFRISHHRPFFEIAPYRDMFGNWCRPLVAPAAAYGLRPTASFATAACPTRVCFAVQHAVEDLPADTLVYLARSPYAKPTGFRTSPGKLSRKTPWAGPGSAICDFVHRHIVFGYEHARATRTAWRLSGRQGRLPRLRHLAIAFLPLHEHSRALFAGLSQRHRTQNWAVGDFAGWFEAYIGGHWSHLRSAQHVPRSAAS